MQDGLDQNWRVRLSGRMARRTLFRDIHTSAGPGPIVGLILVMAATVLAFLHLVFRGAFPLNLVAATCGLTGLLLSFFGGREAMRELVVWWRARRSDAPAVAVNALHGRIFYRHAWFEDPRGSFDREEPDTHTHQPSVSFVETLQFVTPVEVIVVDGREAFSHGPELRELCGIYRRGAYRIDDGRVHVTLSTVAEPPEVRYSSWVTADKLLPGETALVGGIELEHLQFGDLRYHDVETLLAGPPTERLRLRCFLDRCGYRPRRRTKG